MVDEIHIIIASLSASDARSYPASHLVVGTHDENASRCADDAHQAIASHTAVEAQKLCASQTIYETHRRAASR